MSTLKFRAWDGKKMHMVTILHLVEDEPGEVQLKSGDWFNGKETPLMQFTGLKDKNGKEIYEGDIVRVVLAPERMSSPVQDGGEVWFSEQAMFLWGKKDDWGECFIQNESYEVIGNSYANPELLQQ